MSALLGVLLAAAIDGEAALRHASALASLGPHAYGSPRDEAAALYVAAQMRGAGLSQVELQRFERRGIQGTNVIATLPAPAEEFVLVAAHHDSAPGAPGAYDDGGGVGILIELARALASEPRTRALVFASFDGEEAEVAGKGSTTGSRAYLERLGSRARSLVAVLDVEMSGWGRGTPVLHPFAYPDPRRPGSTLVAPAWLVRTVLAGSREGGAALGLGDPYQSWVYQPAVRIFRVRLHGDDISFVQAGRPAVFVSDSSPSFFYPEYHKPGDTAERIDAGSLGRMGRAVLGAVRALDRVPAGPAEEPHWFAAFGSVVGWPWLLGLGALSLLPGLRAGFATGGLALGQRLLESALFAVLLWRLPVPALWTFLLPHLLLPFSRRRVWLLVAVAPLTAMLALGIVAWWRGAVNGVWLAPWEIALAAVTFALALLALPGRVGGRSGRGRTPPGSPRRKGR